MRIAKLRATLDLYPDLGEDPTTRVDTAGGPTPLPELEAWTSARCETIALAPAADDQAVTFTDAAGLLIVSDAPIGVRLAAGEVLLESVRLFAVWSDEADAGVHQTSVLLTGNGVSTANVAVHVVEAT